MDFTSNEKRAIIAVLSSIMKADGIEAPNEQAFIRDKYGDLGINIEDFQHIAAMDMNDCKQIFHAMSGEKKERVHKCFLDMVGIDGRVDLRELRVLHELIK